MRTYHALYKPSTRKNPRRTRGAKANPYPRATRARKNPDERDPDRDYESEAYESILKYLATPGDNQKEKVRSVFMGFTTGAEGADFNAAWKGALKDAEIEHVSGDEYRLTRKGSNELVKLHRDDPWSNPKKKAAKRKATKRKAAKRNPNSRAPRAPWSPQVVSGWKELDYTSTPGDITDWSKVIGGVEYRATWADATDIGSAVARETVTEVQYFTPDGEWNFEIRLDGDRAPTYKEILGEVEVRIKTQGKPNPPKRKAAKRRATRAIRNPIEVEEYDSEVYARIVKEMPTRQITNALREIESRGPKFSAIDKSMALVLSQEAADRATAMLGIPREILVPPKGNPKRKAAKRKPTKKRNPSEHKNTPGNRKEVEMYAKDHGVKVEYIRHEDLWQVDNGVGGPSILTPDPIEAIREIRASSERRASKRKATKRNPATSPRVGSVVNGWTVERVSKCEGLPESIALYNDRYGTRYYLKVEYNIVSETTVPIAMSLDVILYKTGEGSLGMEKFAANSISSDLDAVTKWASTIIRSAEPNPKRRASKRKATKKKNPEDRRKEPSFIYWIDEPARLVEEEEAYTVYAGWADQAVRPSKWQRYRAWALPSDPNGPEYALLENWNWFAPSAKFFFITKRDTDVILARLEKDDSGGVTIVSEFQEPTEEALARAFAAGEIKRLIKTPNPREGNPKGKAKKKPAKRKVVRSKGKTKKKNPNDPYDVYAGMPRDATNPVNWMGYRSWVDPDDPNGPEDALREIQRDHAPNAMFFIIHDNRDAEMKILARLKTTDGNPEIVASFDPAVEKGLAGYFNKTGNPGRKAARRRPGQIHRRDLKATPRAVRNPTSSAGIHQMIADGITKEVESAYKKESGFYTSKALAPAGTLLIAPREVLEYGEKTYSGDSAQWRWVNFSNGGTLLGEGVEKTASAAIAEASTALVKWASPLISIVLERVIKAGKKTDTDRITKAMAKFQLRTFSVDGTKLPTAGKVVTKKGPDRMTVKIFGEKPKASWSSAGDVVWYVQILDDDGNPIGGKDGKKGSGKVGPLLDGVTVDSTVNMLTGLFQGEDDAIEANPIQRKRLNAKARRMTAKKNGIGDWIGGPKRTVKEGRLETSEVGSFEHAVGIPQDPTAAHQIGYYEGILRGINTCKWYPSPSGMWDRYKFRREMRQRYFDAINNLAVDITQAPKKVRRIAKIK